MRLCGDPAQDLQKRRLAGPVAADDADALALGDLERDVAEHPVLLVELVPEGAEQRLLQLVVAVHVELERLADALAADHRIDLRRPRGLR